ncbi:MAG: glycoside hydrolase [Patescibacteria group bacterium]|nr:glycoside hydrolase [Patescibacteria group bacterium]
MKNTCVIFLLLFFIINVNCGTDPIKNSFEQIDLFEKGDLYHNYRIPSIIVTPRGTILAFCEGRSKDSDAGDIDLVLKRSFDNGAAWGPLQVVWDDGGNTCGNPCPVVDRETGTIWLLLTHNYGQDTQQQIEAGSGIGTRTFWVTKSTDEGTTWSKPVNISETTRKSDWTFCGTGPGIGIQLANGRLIIPCYHKLSGAPASEPIWPCHVIYSDDHGATWKLGGIVADHGDESTIVELADGTLLLNMRDDTGRHMRAISTSTDGGFTWSKTFSDDELIEPECQGSLIRFTDKIHNDRNRILFSNPASRTKREKMTVRLSYDECMTWPVSKQLTSDLSAYSCLAILKNGAIACLYERGKNSYNEYITLARFNLEWLTDGSDSLVK